jgi:hypothetical protein
MMDFSFQLLSQFKDALLHVLIQPFYYVGLLFIVLQYRHQIALERKLFHSKLHSLLGETWRTTLWGLMIGLGASVLMAAAGTALQTGALIVLWIVSLVLILFRVRYFCFAYSAGILGVLHSIAAAFPPLANIDGIGWLIGVLTDLTMSSILLLVAILHLAEAVLIRSQGARQASPLFYQGKRGKLVGGYHMQGFWPVPLFLLVPVQAGTGMTLPWQPLLGIGGSSVSWALIAFPVVIGYAEMTVSRLPQAKAKWTSGLLFLYGAAIFLLAVCVELWPVLTIGASLACIMLHELLVWYSRWEEARRSAIFVHDERGLMILGVIPSSPAEQLGIVPGEIIHGVNGVKVRDKEQLHQALQLNSAFCKLEVINLEGQSKFLKRAKFSGEHHQLGIILAPDEDAKYYVGVGQKTGIGSYLRTKLSGLSTRGTDQKM